jgi:hypothetical protein
MKQIDTNHWLPPDMRQIELLLHAMPWVLSSKYFYLFILLFLVPASRGASVRSCTHSRTLPMRMCTGGSSSMAERGREYWWSTNIGGGPQNGTHLHCLYMHSFPTWWPESTVVADMRTSSKYIYSVYERSRNRWSSRSMDALSFSRPLCLRPASLLTHVHHLVRDRWG